MAKFIIECPYCGNYAEAQTGFFARKKINCSCGNVINVRTDKLKTRRCAHCGNDVVFDQSKGNDAKCPVCGELINTVEIQNKFNEFSCQQCGAKLSASKGSTTYTCPVCDFVNDVSKRIAQEKIRKEGLASVIKYEGDNDTFVWKHPLEDFNMGSQLIVHESQEAIFFRDGQALDLFGAGRYTLETQQLPILEKVYNIPSDSDATFHSEVYFINLATQMGVKWGTDSKVRLFDPYSGLYIEIGACGEFNIRVINSRKLLLKIVGTSDKMLQDQLLGNGINKTFFHAMIMSNVKSYLAKAIKENNINILEIDIHLMELSNALRGLLNSTLYEYGLEITEFFVSRVLLPDDDPNFKRMKEQYAEQYLLVRQEEIKKKEAEAAYHRKAIEAKTKADMKILEARGDAEALKIKKFAESEAYKAQAEAEAAEMQMKGYTYQQESSRLIGLEAMQNGIGNIGSDGNGSSMIGDIANLGVTLGAMGGVIGMTKDIMTPIINTSGEMGAAISGMTEVKKDTWDCQCGQKDIVGNFCSNCGAKRPINNNEIWSCICGQTGITGNFCPNCGMKKPTDNVEDWICPNCGKRNVNGKFCSQCGSKRIGD